MKSKTSVVRYLNPFQQAVLALLTLFATASPCLGQTLVHQPGFVYFQNNEPVGGNHRVYGLPPSQGGHGLVGTQWVAELYYLDVFNSLVPVPSSISHFPDSTTLAPGFWTSPPGAVVLAPAYGGVDIITFPDGPPMEAGDGSGTGVGYYPVTLEVAVWDTTSGNTYETAVIRGASPLFSYTQRYSVPPSVFDGDMLNQPSFSVLIPEPSVLGLGVLGLPFLLLCRRRRSSSKH